MFPPMTGCDRMILPPRMTTRSAGWPAAASQGGGMGGRASRGGGRTAGRSGDQGNGRNDGQGGRVGGQGSEVNDGVDGLPNFSTIIAQQLQNLLPTIVAQVGCDNQDLSGYFDCLYLIWCALFLVKLAMSPFLPKKFRMGVAIATRRKGYYKPGTRAWVSRVSRKIRIPIAMYPCRVEERLTIELVEGREVEKIVTTVTKNGVVTRYPGKFHEYQLTDKEKEFERMMIYWEQVEYEVSDDDDSDLKSTARSVPKDYELEDTGSSNGI
ncbi:hypothetical protein Tco_1420588 [Tanacetum coccineum]